MVKEIVISGFPKCGTTALIGQFEAVPGITVLKSEAGSTEIAWPSIRGKAVEFRDSLLGVHKYSAYIFDAQALEWLAKTNLERHFVLCIRDLTRVLVSWHNMHRQIARNAKSPTHFAYMERDFYADCSIPEYYKRFARNHMQQDMYFHRFLEIVGSERITVVSQERMAREIESIASWLVARVRDGEDRPLVTTGENITETHQGYAEKADIPIPREIRAELLAIQARLHKAIARSGVQTAI